MLYKKRAICGITNGFSRNRHDDFFNETEVALVVKNVKKSFSNL